MIKPEKFHEPILHVLLRTSLTAVILASIFNYKELFAGDFSSKMKLLGIESAATMCFVFGGHWLEIFFINFLKNYLPKNLFVLYPVRIAYWYISAIPLYFLYHYVSNFLTGKNYEIGNWWMIGITYIFIEMVMYGILFLLMRKSFWNGVY